MDVKSLKGIAVVSIAHGEKVGTVENMLFDLDARRVVALKIRSSNLPGSGRKLIPMPDVQNIGPDAVMIKDKECIRNEKGDREFHNRPDLSALAGLRVVTQDGTYVGNLATMQFNPDGGELTAIETTGGGLIDLLRRNQVIDISEVISIGSDVVVVPDAYAPSSSNADSEEAGRSQDSSDGDKSDDEKVLQLPAGSDDSRH